MRTATVTHLFLLMLAGFVLRIAISAAHADSIVQTFTLHERFAVDYPDEIVDFDLEKPIDPTDCYMVGPNGVEVPFQILDNGKKLAIRTALPSSRLPMQVPLGVSGRTWKLDGLENYLNVQGMVMAGDVVRFSGKGLPGGLKADRNYVCIDVKWVPNFGGLAAFSETMGGPAVPITSDGKDTRMTVLPFVVDIEASRVYSPKHGFHDGDPVSFHSSGILPAPLHQDTTYIVRFPNDDTFQLSTVDARHGDIVTFTDSGTGFPEVKVDWTWTLKRGHPAKAFAQGVQVKQAAEGWELTNGLTGIRLPHTQIPADPNRALAPVQGVQLTDGAWTGVGPNTIFFIGRARVTKLTTTFVEQGPLKVVVELTYTLARNQAMYGKDIVCPAGPGKYACRIEMQAGQPSVLFEEETNCQFGYSFAFKGITLNQARWRGHSSTNPQYGRRVDGKLDRDGKPAPVDLSCDAIMDLPFDADYQSSYVSNFRDHCIRWISPWDIWIFDSGHYWTLFNKDGDDASPLIGFYDGRASRLREAGACGVGVFTRSPVNGGPTAGLTVQAWQRGPDARMYPNPRFTWRLYVARKGPDINPRPGAVEPPILAQLNLHSGIGLNKIHRIDLSFASASKDFGSLYMKPDATRAVVKNIREDQRFYGFAYNAVSYYRDMIDMWRDDSGDKVHAMAFSLWLGAHFGMRALVSRMGIYGFSYWNAGLDASRSMMRIDQVLASDTATEADKVMVRQAAVFYGAVLWDDDHAPLSVPAGVNLGTANMPIQQQGYRDMYALFLAKHPLFTDRAAGVADRVRGLLYGSINEFGAHMGSSHYIDAANGPLLSSIQQLKTAGIVDQFRDESRLKKYAEFEMNFSTPPDPRFGLPPDQRQPRRVRPSIGDACPGENTEFLGQLGTGFADVDPTLSARLMGLWRAVGKPESDFHGATILKIDERLPDADPKLASYHAEGWYSALRFGWNTPNETTAWFVNGQWYRDHASNDLGEPVIYALCAPLSLDFGTMYTPPSPGGFVHSVVLPEAQLGDWKLNPPDVNRGGRWGQAKTLDFKVLDREAWSKASFQMKDATWTRTLKLSMLQDNLPVIGIRDDFTTRDSKVFLLNLMNEGVIQAPDGAKNVGDCFTIPAGVTKLHYTGQAFRRHPAGGIDWDLYVVTDDPQEAFIAQYAHKNVMPETQSILRLKGTGPFQVIIVAYTKGTQLPPVSVTRQNGRILVSTADKQAEF